MPELTRNIQASVVGQVGATLWRTLATCWVMNLMQEMQVYIRSSSALITPTICFLSFFCLLKWNKGQKFKFQSRPLHTPKPETCSIWPDKHISLFETLLEVRIDRSSHFNRIWRLFSAELWNLWAPPSVAWQRSMIGRRYIQLTSAVSVLWVELRAIRSSITHDEHSARASITSFLTPLSPLSTLSANILHGCISLSCTLAEVPFSITELTLCQILNAHFLTLVCQKLKMVPFPLYSEAQRRSQSPQL